MEILSSKIPLSRHKNAHILSRVGFLATLITNLSLKITSDVPLSSYMSIFLKNSNLLNDVQNTFKGVSSIWIMIMAIKSATMTSSGSTSRCWWKHQLGLLALKVQPRFYWHQDYKFYIKIRYIGLLRCRNYQHHTNCHHFWRKTRKYKIFF